VLGVAAGGAHSLALAPVPPVLQLSRAGQGLILSWSAAWSPEVENVVLETATAIPDGNWTALTLPGRVVAGRYEVPVAIGQQRQFFRLRVEPQ
jgi:hypothetical protein